MNTKRIWMVAGLLMLVAVLPAAATIRSVAQSGTAQYLTVMAAYNAAVHGDTIVVAPGVYAEAINCYKRLVITGAGYDQTQVTSVTLGNGSQRAIVQGLRIENPSGTGLSINVNDTVTVRRCLVRASAPVSVSSGSLGRTVLEDCVFLSTAWGDIVQVGVGNVVLRNCIVAAANPNASTDGVEGANGLVEVYNCVFVSLGRVLGLTGTQIVVFINNVVYDWFGTPNFGVYLAGSVFAHNAAGGMVPPGDNAVQLTTNPFVAYNADSTFNPFADFHLNNTAGGGAACVDVGHPEILDLDASVSDLGVYGGPRPYVANGVPDYPFIISYSISPTLIGVGDDVNVSSTGRIGPRY